MCKVMMIAGIKPDKIPQVYKLAKNMAKNMSLVEDDGVGYAAITKGGQIYGEKWLNKDDAFNVHAAPPPDPIVEKIRSEFDSSIEWDKTPPSTINCYTSFGQRTGKSIEETVAVILHARKATQGEKTVENVHPFVTVGDGDATPSVALIHNGSILNHDKLTKTMSTCDSEVILHEYNANQMYHNPWGVQQLAKTLVGTYTVGALGSQLIDDEWVPYLDIFKSNKELYGGWVTELETMVFCTAQYTLEQAVKESGLTIKNIVKMKDGFLHRINALTGEHIEKPILFSTSAQYMTGYNRQHEHSMVGTMRGGTTAGDNNFQYGPQKENLIDAKKRFEQHHPSLFTAPYLEGQELTDDEKAYFDELKKNDQTHHAALKLVSVALNQARI